MTRSNRKFYILIFVGGLIVGATFLVGWIFGKATWTAWWISSVLHFIGGAYAFFFVRELYFYAKNRYEIKMPFWMEIWLFVCGALVLGVFWEWYELLIDRYSVFVLGERSIMTYADNIGDLIIDAVGAVAAAIYCVKKMRDATAK